MTEPQFDPLVSTTDIPSDIYEDENMNTVIKSVVVRDSSVSTIEDQAREIAALRAQVESLKPKPKVSAPQGGPAVSHHLHLSDGRVIPNHGGTGTHYSETLPDGTTRLTRVVNYYPVDDASPIANIA